MAIVYTGRVYDYKKILVQIPDAYFISVMRRPWRYTSSQVELRRDLGPSEELLEKVLSFEGNAAEEVGLQDSYTREYLEMLRTMDLTSVGIGHNEIVLLCREIYPAFCHRHILKDYLIEHYGWQDGGEVTPEGIVKHEWICSGCRHGEYCEFRSVLERVSPCGLFEPAEWWKTTKVEKIVAAISKEQMIQRHGFYQATLEE